MDRAAADATGADRRALLATSLQEAGAQRGHVGDQGTSYGPFQFHRGGALGTHTPAWANSYAAVLDRAQNFKRYGVHGGPGAAAVQRPADRAGYAQHVNALLKEADRILRQYGHAPAKPSTRTTPAAVPDIPGVTPVDDNPDHGPLMVEALRNLHTLSGLSTPGISGNPRRDALNQLAQFSGMPAPTCRSSRRRRRARSLGANRPEEAKTTRATTATLMDVGRVVPFKPKIIGTPHSGTHTLGNWESDNAVDIAMPVGTAIRAPADGVIGSQIGSSVRRARVSRARRRAPQDEGRRALPGTPLAPGGQGRAARQGWADHRLLGCRQRRRPPAPRCACRSLPLRVTVLLVIAGLGLLALGLIVSGYPVPAIAVLIYALFLLVLHNPF